MPDAAALHVHSSDRAFLEGGPPRRSCQRSWRFPSNGSSTCARGWRHVECQCQSSPNCVSDSRRAQSYSVAATQEEPIEPSPVRGIEACRISRQHKPPHARPTAGREPAVRTEASLGWAMVWAASAMCRSTRPIWSSPSVSSRQKAHVHRSRRSA